LEPTASFDGKAGFRFRYGKQDEHHLEAIGAGLDSYSETPSRLGFDRDVVPTRRSIRRLSHIDVVHGDEAGMPKCGRAGGNFPRTPCAWMLSE